MNGKTLLIQQVYQGSSYTDILAMCYPRHLNYCKKHNIDYCVEFGNIIDEWPMEHGGWAKLPLIAVKLKLGYSRVVWLDCDTVIADMDADISEGCPASGIGMTLHRNDANEWHNVGAMYFTNSERVIQFIEDWIGWYPGPLYGWHENAMLMLLSKFSDVVVTIDDKYNSSMSGRNQVENPVVEGFHGAGTVEEKYALMKGFLAGLEAKEKAHGKNK